MSIFDIDHSLIIMAIKLAISHLITVNGLFGGFISLRCHWCDNAVIPPTHHDYELFKFDILQLIWHPILSIPLTNNNLSLQNGK